jgi:hypothetical protein
VGELAADYLSADVPVWLFLVTAALVAAYGLFTGIESRGRKYGILFWLLVLPLAVVFLLAFGSVKPGRLLGQAGLDGSSLRGAWQVFCFLQGTAFLPVYAPVAENPEALVRAAKRGFCLAAAGNVALYLLLSGVFGVPTLAVMEHGALTLTALVKIPGGFLERQDALLCGIWILSVYAFAENSMGIMCYCLGGLENERQGHVAAVLSVLAALALGLCMHGFPKCQDAMWWLWRSLVVPVLTAVGIVGAILTKWRCKKRKEQSWDEAEE